MAGVSSVADHNVPARPWRNPKPKNRFETSSGGARVRTAAVNMRGLKCPLPALKTRKLLAKMAAGEVLTIECTDPLTTIDIPNLAARDRRQDRGQREERPSADVPDQEELTRGHSGKRRARNPDASGCLCFWIPGSHP